MNYAPSSPGSGPMTAVESVETSRRTGTAGRQTVRPSLSIAAPTVARGLGAAMAGQEDGDDLCVFARDSQ